MTIHLCTRSLRGTGSFLWSLTFFGIATVAAAIDFEREGWGAWIVVAMTLLAGSQLHNLFWPSAYTSTLTSANVLRLAFAATIAFGGVIELRRVAGERAEGLAQAQNMPIGSQT